MHSTALIIVPPMVKYCNGPLLGPALIAGAAAKAGHRVEVLDLNQRYILEALTPGRPVLPSRLTGDHDKPVEALREVHDGYRYELSQHLPARQQSRRAAELTLTFDHATVLQAAQSLARSPLGRFMNGEIERALAALHTRPSVIGISVLYAGQVLCGLTLSMLARELCPDVRVVWGGSHVTALAPEIAIDPRYGEAIDLFLAGPGAGAFVDLLDAEARKNGETPSQFFEAGCGGARRGTHDNEALPRFTHLNEYGIGRLTLPAQTSRGCAYGRCAYCTYPAIEGEHQDLGLRQLAYTTDLATEVGAAISIKDSLLLPGRLQEIANLIDGKVPWAGSTKLHSSLSPDFLHRLAASGCRTLEFGLESLIPETQRLIRKRQSIDLLRRVLDGCAQSGIQPVVNVITGFPGENHISATEMLAEIQETMVQAGGPDFGHLEHNRFELERRAAMATNPRVRVTASWPWATVMDWEMAEASAAA